VDEAKAIELIATRQLASYTCFMADRAINISLSEAQLNANPLLKDMVEHVVKGDRVVVKRGGKVVGRLNPDRTDAKQAKPIKPASGKTKPKFSQSKSHAPRKARSSAIKMWLARPKPRLGPGLTINKLMKEGRK
jgi:hypothetical protein